MDRKEAIEIIKKNWPDSSFTRLRNALETLIPELKESEESKDEEMIKSMTRLVGAFYSCSFPTPEGFKRKDLLAWLIKQGEHANFRNKIQIGDKVTRNEDGVLVNLSQLNRVAKKQGEQDEFTKKELECVRGYRKRAIKRLEELKEISVEQILANSAKPCKDEQKPAEKTEPKFKVGDWVVHNNANFIYQVVSIGSYGYKVITRGNYKMIILSNNEDKYHLWTIQDAKEGDVLYSPKGIGVEGIFLIKGWKQVEYTGKTLCSSIVYRVEEDKIVVGGIGAIWWNGVFDQFYPATKEQRDLLFKKMHEAGYEWNVEKKELKKIDQNFILNEVQPKQITPEEPAWSEEDENALKVVTSIFEIHGVNLLNYSAFVHWLKTLPNRITFNPYWKPSDEQIKSIQESIGIVGELTPRGECLKELVEQLKKLREE